jgi:hypothetical protein
MLCDDDKRTELLPPEKLGPVPKAALTTVAQSSTAPSGASCSPGPHLPGERYAYKTDGKTRRIRVGRRELILKHTSPRNVAAAGRTSGLVIQALRYLGKTNVTKDRIEHLRTMLSSQDRKRLIRDLRLAPAWMHTHLRFIAGEGSSS